MPSYVDLSDHTGWMHIYLYPVSGGDPLALTSGEWEVTSISRVDAQRGVVYYISTERDSTERHLFSVGLDGKNKKALVDTTADGYWSASFSSGGGYYLLTVRSPPQPCCACRADSELVRRPRHSLPSPPLHQLLHPTANPHRQRCPKVLTLQVRPSENHLAHTAPPIGVHPQRR